MDEKPKSLWKKPWTGPRGMLLWFSLIAAVAFVLIFGVGLLTGGTNSLAESAAFSLLFAAVLAVIAVLAVALIRWLFCRRNFKRSLFALACLATVVALLYAEEDWRGKHALEKFKRGWEAKGEKFDFAGIAPAPVPDEQNFAMSPVIASSYSTMLDANGHEMKPRNTNVINRLEMHTYEQIGGIDGPKGNGGWRKGQITDLKEWQEYYHRAASRTNLFPIPSEPQSPAADVLLALSKYDSTIKELREAASQRPHSRYPLNYGGGFPMAILLPHLASLKGCVQVLELRAIAELDSGQSEKALDDINLMLRLADSIRTEPLLISHLVRIALVSIAIQPVWEGLAEHKWSEAQLAVLERELGTLDFLADYEYAMRGERACSISAIEYVRRHRQYIGYMNEGDNGTPDSPFVASVSHLIPASFFYQNELAIARMHQQWILPLVDVERRIVSPEMTRQATNSIVQLGRRYNPYTIFAAMLVPALGRSAERFGSTQTAIDLARVACALERYRLVHGQYPEALDVLAPQFIDKIPHDIINGQPLKYRCTGDGQFVLYSVGWNETDDGGQVALTKTGTVDVEKGDWVWQYPK